MDSYTKLYETLKLNKDVVIVKDEFLNYTFFYQEQLCNMNLFNKDYIKQIRDNKELKLDEVIIGICKKFKYKEDEIKELYQIIFQGLLVVYDHCDDIFYLFDISQAPSRTTSDPISEPESISGSRDGFVENYKTNISLIRTRIKSSNLEIDDYMIGKRSKTYVGLLSISDIHNLDMKEKIKSKLSELDVDAILELEDITTIFQENKKLPTFSYIGSPDLACRHLLDGQFLIVVDRISNLICLPITIDSYTRQRMDFSNIRIYSYFQRLFVLFAFLFSTLFLGFFASMITFQKDSLSLMILSFLKINQSNIILPIFFQIAFILFLFELYFIIGFRASKVSMSGMIVFIGGIIIGQNIVESRIVGVMVMFLTALTFLTSFTVSSNITLIMSISIIRMIILIGSLFYGMFGVVIASVIVFSTILKEKTFEVSFFSPFIPFDYNGIKSFFAPQSQQNKIHRPVPFKTIDRKMKNEKNT